MRNLHLISLAAVLLSAAPRATADGTTLWGQAALLSTGTHQRQRRQVPVLPEKPVKQVGFYMFLRGRVGTNESMGEYPQAEIVRKWRES